jgi:hypothetical protein
MDAAVPARAMVRWRGFLMVLLAACGSRDVADGGFDRAETTSVNASGCAVDDDCGPGLLCETCGDGVFTCVPGCRTDAACGANMRCSHQVQCTTCPCPSGWCELDPCRDFDGDGFAAALTGTCPGKQLGDCNDSSPVVRPGGLERCANGIDDDCDGRTDARDDGCRASCPGTRFCATALSCGLTGHCTEGCCEACPTVVEPTCGAGECAIELGVDVDGCRKTPACRPCASSCPTDGGPVCGRNYATYVNACHALHAGTTVMHDGACAYGEGARCAQDAPGDCWYQQFCRELDGEKHCTQLGVCTTAADCRHLTPSSCGDAGVATWACTQERCAASCP